jgi:transposase
MKKTYRRHDITDAAWKKLSPHLPGQVGQWGRVAKDNRNFINAVFWILRTGAPWRDLPPDYGKWGTINQRFNRWRANGTWEKLMNLLVNEPDYEWLMIDASHIKVHHMRREPKAAIKRWRAQKGAKYEDTFDGRCTRHACKDISFGGNSA